MEEDLIFNDQNVTITRSRLIMGGKTYVLKNISSVELAHVAPNNSPYFVTIVIGLLAFWLAGESLRWFGLIGAGIAAYLIFINKGTYAVRLSSTSGEVDGLTSKDQDYVSKVVSAINKAITVM